MTEALTFHKGIDYAVVMRPNEMTETALARLYGEDRHVTKFGNLFAAAPVLLAELEELADKVRCAGEAGHFENWQPAYKRAMAAIAKAKPKA